MSAAEEEDTNFERRLNEVTAGLQRYIRTHLLERVSRINAITIVDYIEALNTEVNPVNATKEITIVILMQLSEWYKNKKSFREMTRQDIIAFLGRLRKKDDEDVLHHWIGTYNNNVITINRFFKWLYYPLVEPRDIPKPDVIQNVCS